MNYALSMFFMCLVLLLMGLILVLPWPLQLYLIVAQLVCLGLQLFFGSRIYRDF